MLDIDTGPVEVAQREEWIATDDGWRLAANVYASSAAPRAVLVINSVGGQLFALSKDVEHRSFGDAACTGE